MLNKQLKYLTKLLDLLAFLALVVGVGILLSVVMTLLPGFQPASVSGANLDTGVAPASWKVFVNAEDHYSFKYPPSAKVTRPYSQNTTIDLESGILMTIVSWRNPKHLSASGWVEVLNAPATSVEEPWIKNLRPFTTDSWEGVIADIEVDPAVPKEAIFVTAEGRIYKFTFPGQDNPFDPQGYEHYKTFLQIIRTLRFGVYQRSSVEVKQLEERLLGATQCSGAPFLLPTSGNVNLLFHQ